jgi:hypothetical protein
MKVRIYTKLAKWYNLIYLGIFTIGSIAYAISVLLGAYGDAFDITDIVCNWNHRKHCHLWNWPRTSMGKVVGDRDS